eukprot:752102-Hanusia_phi.AAC.5
MKEAGCAGKGILDGQGGEGGYRSSCSELLPPPEQSVSYQHSQHADMSPHSCSQWWVGWWSLPSPAGSPRARPCCMLVIDTGGTWRGELTCSAS